MLGNAEHIFPYQWVIDLSIDERKVISSEHSKYSEACISQVQHSSVDLWHQRLGHLSPTNMEKMKSELMVTGMTLPNVDLSKHIGSCGTCDAS
jgi:GAG-pre-integrase domain